MARKLRDDEYEEYRRAGMSFKSGGTQPGVPNRRTGEVYTNDPDIKDFGPQDLRYGGEDLSGMSEWSMRAHNLDLEDGLDGGDFIRSDAEILMEIFDSCEDLGLRSRGIDFEISGAEVTLRGQVESAAIRERYEAMLTEIPGVKAVRNMLEVSESG